jgi:hypothetical protein
VQWLEDFGRCWKIYRCTMIIHDIKTTRPATKVGQSYNWPSTVTTHVLPPWHLAVFCLPLHQDEKKEKKEKKKKKESPVSDRWFTMQFDRFLYGTPPFLLRSTLYIL